MSDQSAHLVSFQKVSSNESGPCPSGQYPQLCDIFTGMDSQRVVCKNFTFRSLLPLRSMRLLKVTSFLGPRGPLGLPSLVRPPVGAKNLDQLYSSINQQRITANLSDIVSCMSGGVWWCLMHVWWCLVVSMYIGWYDLNWLMYMGRYPFQCM